MVYSAVENDSTRVASAIDDDLDPSPRQVQDELAQLCNAINLYSPDNLLQDVYTLGCYAKGWLRPPRRGGP